MVTLAEALEAGLARMWQAQDNGDVAHGANTLALFCMLYADSLRLAGKDAEADMVMSAVDLYIDMTEPLPEGLVN